MPNLPTRAYELLPPISVTRLDDLLDFGQNFKDFGNKQLAQISLILGQFL